MLSLRIEKLGDITLIHCAGRMVFPYNREFRIRLLQQLQTRTLVLEFVDTIAIDASGLGLLVSLRTWATQTGRALKLMNVTPRVDRLLQMTRLKSEFEICSVREMLDLLCRAIHQSAPTIASLDDSDVSTPCATASVRNSQGPVSQVWGTTPSPRYLVTL